MIQATARRRAEELFAEQLDRSRADTSRLFLWLFLVQWAFAIVIAFTLSPYVWAGTHRSIHIHLQLAVMGGLALNSLPLLLILQRPHWAGTRYVIAAAQMLWSALFVHLSGGRVETHFHIFGSLAFLAFYRDPRVILIATLVVAADHLLLGFLDPMSVYGVVNPEWWRFLEHVGWMVFEDVVLIVGSNHQLQLMRALARREADTEQHGVLVEQEVAERTEQLNVTAERYRTLLENTSAIPWEFGIDDARIIYIAPKFAASAKVPPELVEPGRSFLELLHPDDREPFRAYLADARDRHRPLDAIDSRVVQRGKPTLYLRTFVSAQVGTVQADTICGISLDMTRQKSMEMDLLQAQKLESIGHLAAGIAHEINTPTQFIGDNVRFLTTSLQDVFGLVDAAESSLRQSERPSPDDVDWLFQSSEFPYLRREMPRALSQTLEGVERIATIVGAMKEFSHPGLEKTPSDLNRAIRSAITVARNEWKYVSDVETHFDETLPRVSVMPSAFNQVILNLLVNAAQAISDSPRRQPGEKGLIVISTRRLAAEVEICVRDTGGGIPADIRERIFDPFFTTKEVGKGTGQGLAIARDVVVKKHGGRIGVDSVAEVGTTFIITLPLDPVVCPEAVPA